MCGIAGLIWKNSEGRKVEQFRRSASLIKHRGPDGRGEYVDDRLLLVHYRLAILDLSPAGTQPYRTLGDKPIVGVYNGELYNYREIADRFGIERRTLCDTETVFKLMASRGSDVLSEFNGIFSLAQYDSNNKELLLARDRLGVKPLYYLETEKYFAFASEAKVLFDFMDELLIDTRSFREFFAYGSSMSNRTMVQGVRKLPPGCFLRFDMRTFESEINSFWSVADIAPICKRKTTYPQARKRVASLLTDAVQRQCLSDVPVGAYLSGGLDSSMIVALAATHGHTPLKTFSVQFEGSSNSELPLARKVAKRYGTEHHEMEISPRDFVGDLADLIFQYDEPFADPAALPLHLMAARCSPMAKVILQGDGGDELFAGYGRHLDMSQPRRRLLAFAALALTHPNKASRLSFRSRFEGLASWPLSRRLGRLSGRPGFGLLGSILKGEFRAEVETADPLTSFHQAASVVSERDPVSQVLLADMMTILPNTFLEKVDKVSMWHGIEARVPFLDNDLVEYVATLPGRFRIRRGVTKMMLREIAEEHLPPEVVIGRKQSFGTPMGIWLKTLLVDFARNVFARAERQWADFFEFSVIEKLFEDHISGNSDHALILWRLIVLFCWLDRYSGKITFPRRKGYDAEG